MNELLTQPGWEKRMKQTHIQYDERMSSVKGGTGYAACLFMIVVLFAGCSKSYDPSDSLTPRHKAKLLSTIARYLVKPPENTPSAERFSKEHDQYYRERVAGCRLEQYYRDGNKEYFLVTQPAPSLAEKRNATGGMLEMSDDELVRYEEVFRTWKMMPDTLRRRSYLLFDKMVRGESLQRFRTKFTAPYEYIEFPDDNTWYDVQAREWKMK